MASGDPLSLNAPNRLLSSLVGQKQIRELLDYGWKQLLDLASPKGKHLVIPGDILTADIGKEIAERLNHHSTLFAEPTMTPDDIKSVISNILSLVGVWVRITPNKIDDKILEAVKFLLDNPFIIDTLLALSKSDKANFAQVLTVKIFELMHSQK